MSSTNEELWSLNTKFLRVVDMKKMLKDIGSYNCFKNKDEYLKRIKTYKKCFNFPWRKDQQEVIDNFKKFDKKNYVVHAVFGAGKCHAKDTKIIMYDGSVKRVQDIEVGEFLMGDDSTPREVLSLARGVDKMYEIIPIKGYSYIVNEPHILCLKVTGYPCITHEERRHAYYVKWVENNKMVSKSFTYKKHSIEDKIIKKEEGQNFLNNINNEQILELSVKDYLNVPKGIRSMLKGYKVPINFSEKQLPFDPYMIGYWLGDGQSEGTRITSQDSTVLYYFLKNLGKYNLILTYIDQYDYNINSGLNPKDKFKACNIFLSTLQDLNLINNKHIPEIYKCNSRENRLKLLAGLIDSDGYLSENDGYEFTQKNEKVMDDVIFLCRSLGFACYKSIKNKGKEFRIMINGEGIDKIPVLIPRKKSPPRRQIKDVLSVGIKEVKYIGEDNYYGFTIDGNSRYLLEDFTVTHNTTLLLGLLINGIFKGLFKPEEIMFISFNISIKNEIKRKLKDYGVSNKVSVRTFDSIIYEICKIGKYKYLDLPNFEGKRKFVYELCFDKEFTHIPSYQPKIIFIDECQDLEMQTLVILKHFFPNSKYVFAGDIFQSIQKEPRESILWHFMNAPEDNDTYKIYMSETPRVPPKTLETIKQALKIYYPEFKDKINNWKSGNTISDENIEWRRFNSYTHIFSDLKEFLKTHSPKETMILTFSAAITVRGGMGDIARVRRYMLENNIKVNTDHKKLDPDTYFLSTSNSSKGLERDYVIIFLTFPLERAFVHLSNDVVVNLITVALTRAKKKVIMYVPAYEDKYTQVLSIFEKCPEPNKKKIIDGKILKEFKFQDYIDIEHCVTALIRIGIIKYDTRIKLKEHTKVFNFGKIFDEDMSYKTAPIITEEERCFVGVLIENLITSTWVGKWPKIVLDEKVSANPMYAHILTRVSNSIKKYNIFMRNNSFNDQNQFEGIYMYSQAHSALSNKIFMRLSDGLVLNLKNYWKKLKPKSYLMKPHAPKLKIQVPVQMPWITGIADSITVDEDGKTTSLYEIKASQLMEWKDDALLQIICYALMTGKSWSRLHLLNPFRNEKISYYFDTKNILTLRKELLNDILIWNTNAMMAKMYPKTKDNKKMTVTNTLFINLYKNEKEEVTQASIINMLSPIKAEILYNKYVTSGLKKTKDMKKEDRFACESNITEEELIFEVNKILKSEVHKDKVLLTFDDYKEIEIFTNSIKNHYRLQKFEDIVNFLEYKRNENLNYSADFTDSFVQNIFCISYLFLKNHFV